MHSAEELINAKNGVLCMFEKIRFTFCAGSIDPRYAIRRSQTPCGMDYDVRSCRFGNSSAATNGMPIIQASTREGKRIMNLTEVAEPCSEHWWWRLLT